MSFRHLRAPPLAPDDFPPLFVERLFVELRAAKQMMIELVDEGPLDGEGKRALDDYFTVARNTLALVEMLLDDWQPPGRAN